ncbi:MAG: DUF697 domain-containing protein [Synechococcales cyanobacterium CRU_2_2]|nr:DUF697 domain-containing protein [Synechococcales cyanobacterium CRU_2_2]
MPLSRLLILITGLVIILGMALWLVDSLQRLFWNLSYISPVLAGLLILLIIALFGLLIFAFLYYANLIRMPSRFTAKRIPPEVPKAKTEAAEKNLQALQQQVSQIQDEVTRQALLERSRSIEASLSRGDLQVVVFGTGSAGKTSMINALIGRIVGRVGAPMGTTDEGATYRLQLRGMERDILITDTPGILEAGMAGGDRGVRARQLAVDADLLLFVSDNDLRRSEFEALQSLAQIGKRSLLILNKIDLLTDTDRELILAQLRERVRDLVAPEDVIAICANPQSVILPDRSIVEPTAEIVPLLRRLAEVLRAEGEDLVADNILLQSQRLGNETRRLLDAQRLRKAEAIVDRFQWISAGVIAMTPLPVVDLLGTAAVNAQMVVELGRVYGCELNMERGRELALSLAKTLTSLGVIKGAVELLTTVMQFNIATIVTSRAIQGVSAAYLTRIAGRSFIEYFRHDQDWGDGGMTEVVQRQFQLSRKDEFVKSFVQQAIAKVVQPITSALRDEVPER